MKLYKNMSDMVCLNPDFSTTRRVTRRPPHIVNEPGSKLARERSREPHPQLLTSAVLAVGAYDLGKRVAMDRHLVLRLLAASGAGSFVKIDRCVSNYRMGGISDKFAAAGFKEVRDNVISYGVSAALANAQYWLHIIKHEVSRWLYRFRLAK